MSPVESFGLGIATVAAVAGVKAVFNVPVPVCWAAFAFGIAFIISGLAPDHQRPTLFQATLYGAGFALIAGTLVWQLQPGSVGPAAALAPQTVGHPVTNAAGANSTSTQNVMGNVTNNGGIVTQGQHGDNKTN